MLAFLIALAAAAQLPAAPPSADPAVPPAAGEVVVTARRDTANEVRDFVGALTPSPTNSTLARFETRAVCPAATGVTPAYAQAIAARMRRVAASAGVPVAKRKCLANVLVMITADKRAFIAALRAGYPMYLAGLSRADIRRIAADPAPAAAWQLAGPGLNADGVELAADPDSGMQVNKTGLAGSRISASGRPHFAGAIVVIERGALVGLTVTQVADYAAMRTFARTDPARLADAGPPTILKVLDAPMGSTVPLTLTTWDLGFLRALYDSPENVSAATQRSAIGRALAREVERAGRRD